MRRVSSFLILSYLFLILIYRYYEIDVYRGSKISLFIYGCLKIVVFLNFLTALTFVSTKNFMKIRTVSTITIFVGRRVNIAAAFSPATKDKVLEALNF